MVALATLPLRPEHSPALAAGARVDAEARAAVGSGGSTNVIVSLRPSRSPEATARDFLSVADDVRAAQASVVSHAGSSARVYHRYRVVPALALTVDDVALSRLAADPLVEAITPDGVNYGADLQSGPIIHADTARAAGYGGYGVTVAVLDSGIATHHPDLSDDLVFQECRLVAGTCPPSGGTTATGPGSAEDDNGHGTNVSGIITSKGTIAPAGIAPDTKIAMFKILAANNSGFFSDWIDALDDIIVNHPEVRAVNMSLVDNIRHPSDCDDFQPAATFAIGVLRSRGVLTFVSSGNNQFKDGITFPACVSSAVAVGATYDYSGSDSGFGCTEATAIDKITCWSNSSASLDLLAPGALITATGLANGTSTYQGTSMAAPHAAAVAALLAQQNPALSADQIVALMTTTGVPLTDPANGRVTPRIDAYAALHSADADGDGLKDIADDCPLTPNPAQADGDSDGLGDACESAAGTDPATNDSDGDGCADGREVRLLAFPEKKGGDRDPLSAWDFFDTPAPALTQANTSGTRDRVVTLADVLAIVTYVGTSDNGPPNSNGVDYDTDLNANGVKDGREYDRAPSTTYLKPWRSRAPSGAVTLQDALVALAQVGDNCTPPP